jgi:hypothetical protein
VPPHRRIVSAATMLFDEPASPLTLIVAPPFSTDETVETKFLTAETKLPNTG